MKIKNVVRDIAVALLLMPGAFYGQDLDYVRSKQVSPAQMTSVRKRILPRTMVFGERQPYVPFWNFSHFYLDRPLYTDVSLRSDRDPAKAGFLRDVKIGQQYGLDGFTGMGYYPLHLWHLKGLAEDQIKDYSHLIVLYPPWPYEPMKEMVEKAAKSPYSTRINGKLVLWGYTNESYIPQFDDKIRRLRKEKGMPEILSISEVPFLSIYAAYGNYESKGQRIPQKILDDFRLKLQDQLDQHDGLQMRIVNRGSRSANGIYGYRTVPAPCYRKYLLPIIMDVLKEPRNQGKLLTAYINHGYVNHFTGALYDELGTEQMRCHLDMAMLFNPDMLVLFEWNEANENTSFQPTVSSGRSLERILNYYLQVCNGESFKPRSGDDVSIPNLIVSLRQSLKLGEPHHIELLYVPDGGKEGCKAQISLRGTTGKLLGTMPLETIPAGQMIAYSYDVPSEQFAGETIVRAELTTEFKRRKQVWKNFDATRIRATSEWNYLYTRHSLRDMLPVRDASFTVTCQEDGTFELVGKLSSPEKLASVEIVDRGDEVWALDKDRVFDRDRYELFRGTFTSRKGGNCKGTIQVKGSSDWKVRSANIAWECFYDGKREGDVYANTVNLTSSRAQFLLAVSKAEVAKAVLKMDYGKGGAYEINLAELKRKGLYSEIKNKSIRLEMERMDNLGDYPLHLDSMDATFKVSLRSPNAYPVYQVRAISKSGKIYRSESVIPVVVSGDREALRVFSETKGHPVKVEVYRSQVPDLNYVFTKDHGAWLVNSYDGRFNAQLGGGWLYPSPMLFADAGPKGFMDHEPAPVWKPSTCQTTYVTQRYAGQNIGCEVADKRESELEFDGYGNYLVFPNEVIPWGAEFTLDFEIKLATADDQVLLRSYSYGEGGLQLIIRNGCLQASYNGIYIAPRVFNTGLKLKVGEWNRIRVSKSFRQLTVRLNEASKSIPYSRRASCFKPLIFGGGTMPGDGIPKDIKPFKGSLRSFRVRHCIVD